MLHENLVKNNIQDPVSPPARKGQSSNFPMKYLWIIEKLSSKSMFYHEFAPDLPLDGILLSGLLSAMNSFSVGELGDSGIESIEMGGLQWVYFSNMETNLMLVAAGEKNCNSALLKARLQVIHDMFVQHFNVDKKFWKEWRYEITQFYEFSKIVETLQQQWSKADQMMNVGAIFDIMGVFQQIFFCFIKIVKDNFAGMKLHSVLKKLHAYKNRLEIWYEQQGLDDSYRVIELFIPAIDLSKDEIVFNEAPATNIFGINPIGLTNDVLTPLFYLVLRHFQTTLQSELGESLWMLVAKKEIMPQILEKWNFIKSLDLDKLLICVIFSD
ncbi:MAG: hypothetical protein ACTSVZ_02860 [Promethearchaeota archaeon]